MKLAWFVGVDWGSQTHQACVIDVAGKLLGERAFEHGGQGLSEMADWVVSFAAGAADQVGVAIETPRGPVVESLMERGLAVHAINPKQLDRFRDRLSPAGAKDDRRDARVLASALRTDPHCLRRLEPADPAIVELREWSRISEELTRERTRQANRMRVRRPQFSWTRIKGESDVKGGGGHGWVEASAGSWVGADGGSPEGERSQRRRRGGWVGGLGARPAVEREPETGRGVAAAARRVA